MRNLEMKCELRSLDIARAALLKAGAVCSGSARQVDTYFTVPSGRLKKRQTDGCEAEYIYYTRPDDGAPKVSVYTRMSEANAIARFGQQELPVRCVVAKTRELWKLDQTRIHLDEVDGLGTFLEFERVLAEHEINLDRAHSDLQKLRALLMPVLGETISRGYAELLEADASEMQPEPGG